MTDEAKAKLSRSALIGLLSAGVGGASGVVGVSFGTGKADARLMAVEVEAQTARRERDELRREIADVRAAVQAHNVDSETKWKMIQRQWDEAREGLRR